MKVQEHRQEALAVVREADPDENRPMAIAQTFLATRADDCANAQGRHAILGQADSGSQAGLAQARVPVPWVGRVVAPFICANAASISG